MRKDGNLYRNVQLRQIAYENQNDVCDFVVHPHENPEREHFEHLDEFYKRYKREIRSEEDFCSLWEEEAGFKELLEGMGDVSGKKILLLGNGTSLKELYFLQFGARCLYTDLSVKAVRHVKAIFNRSDLKQFNHNIEFHAVDAFQLPFSNESFDIIYGCAFVHHIQDLDRLFSELARCLKPGGLCRFLDYAYSPLWQFLKNTALKPLQIYTHWRYGISPADLIASRRGGYKYEELELIRRKFGFREMLYVKLAFFEYLLQRGIIKLGGRRLKKLNPLMKALDTLLDKTVRLVQQQGIVLVWGFTK